MYYIMKLSIIVSLGEETDSLKSGDAKASELRIRKNLVNTLTRKFVDVMKEYQNAQQQYKTDIRKKVKRQVHIVKPDASTEEIDAVLKSGGGSGGVLRNAILNVSSPPALRPAPTASFLSQRIMSYVIAGRSR